MLQCRSVCMEMQMTPVSDLVLVLISKLLVIKELNPLGRTC